MKRFFIIFVALILALCCYAPASRSGKTAETAAPPAKNRQVGLKGNEPIGSLLSPEERDLLLREHNRVRADVRIAPLRWSAELAAFAQEWVDHLAGTVCTLKHRPRSGRWLQKYGENLFMGTAGYYDVGSAVKSWEEEKRDYQGGPIALDSHFYKIGHYTQMIWRRTTSVGCAKAQCRGQIIVACNYDPPGNMIGRRPFD